MSAPRIFWVDYKDSYGRDIRVGVDSEDPDIIVHASFNDKAHTEVPDAFFTFECREELRQLVHEEMSLDAIQWVAND